MATINAVNTTLSGQSGTGSFAGTNGSIFTAPILGTPVSGNLSNCTNTGGLKSFQIFTSGTAQTYTKPAGITSILVEVIGGGGGGGGSTGGVSTISQGGGGGSGGYARLWIPTAAASYTYTVGAGGSAGGAGGGSGGAGGTTTFSASSLQATGGSGGVGMGAIPISSGTAVIAGYPGVGSNGNINAAGMQGTFGLVAFGVINGGQGGSSHYGGGGYTIGVGIPTNGQNYGSGGAGGSSATVSVAGGAGSSGLIIVWEFA